jgi:hypothetical protein
VRKLDKYGLVPWIVGTGLLLLTLPGCGGTAETGDVVAIETGDNGDHGSLEWYRQRPRTGTGGASQGGAPTTGGAVATTGGTPGTIAYDCNLCDQANDCCDAVTPDDRPACSFSSSECLSYTSPESQKNYALYCLTFIRTVITAWQPKSPPAVCLLPN